MRVTQGRVLETIMTLVSPTVPSPGDEANATDISVPVNQLAAVINGGLDDTNISSVSGSKIAAGTVDTAQIADEAVTNAKLATGTGEPGGAWSTWTPTWTNLTVGNGTVTTRYTKIGRLVHGALILQFGSTTSITGSYPTFTLPVATATTGSSQPVGAVAFDYQDVGTARYYGSFALIGTQTTATCVVMNAASTYVQENGVSSTIPMTWVTGDKLTASFWYEAA